MELPDNLKTLYRHWDIYTEPIDQILLPAQVFKDEKLFEEIRYFIGERIAIWQKKTLNEPLPYTNDQVMAKYRFCNIFRELDRQTIEFHRLLNPLRDDFPLWLMNMFYCRMVARTETIERVGFLSFDTEENKQLYERFMESPRPRFGTPYVFPVSTILKSQTPTRELFITDYLPQIMKKVSEEISTWNKLSVYEGREKVIKIFGFNHHFLWTEVLIDVAYQFPEYVDLFKQFPIGPGSRPTLQRINAEEDPSIVVTQLSHISIDTHITYNAKPLRLSAENWEGIGCEFRKYTNLKIGKGRKRLFS